MAAKVAAIYSQFCEEAGLNKKHNPWLRRRVDGEEYGFFRIDMSEATESEQRFWYAKFQGVEFFGIMRYHYRTRHRPYKELKEVIVCRGFKHVRINYGRTVMAKHVVLI